MYLQCLNNFSNEFPTAQQQKNYIKTVLQVQPPRSHDLSALNFICDNTNDLSAFSFSLKWEDTQPTHIWYLSDHSQQPRDI